MWEQSGRLTLMQQVLPSCGLQFAIPLRLSQYLFFGTSPESVSSGLFRVAAVCQEMMSFCDVSESIVISCVSFDPNAASAVRYGAEVLKAASERQASLVANCQCSLLSPFVFGNIV